LATYPVVNKETGEQKEIILSVHDWEQWKKDNSEWDRDWSDPSTCPSSGELGRFMINLRNLIQDGTMFFHEHQKFLDQK
jgi:hypothetical protein